MEQYTGSPVCYNVKVNPIKYSLVMLISSNSFQKNPFNSDSFLDFLKKSVRYLKNKYLLMDNVRFHKTNKVSEFLKNNNITPLFISLYSPQFDPIENVFSLLKSFIKKDNINNDNVIQNLNNSIKKIKKYKFTNFYESCFNK